MTWGMFEPEGEGDYWPIGEYVGWKEGLQAYYDTEMSDADKAAMDMEEEVLFYKFSAKFHANLGRLKDVECPKEFRTHRTVKNLASLIEMKERLFCVDQQLKDIIEELEPGVHQFWPIKISMPRDQEYPKQFYGIAIGNHLDAFRREKSAKGSWRRSGFEAVSTFNTKKVISGLAISSAASEGKHLWRDNDLYRPVLFFSDALMQKIKEARLRIPKHHKLLDVQ